MPVEPMPDWVIRELLRCVKRRAKRAHEVDCGWITLRGMDDVPRDFDLTLQLMHCDCGRAHAEHVANVARGHAILADIGEWDT